MALLAVLALLVGAALAVDNQLLLDCNSSFKSAFAASFASDSIADAQCKAYIDLNTCLTGVLMRGIRNMSMYSGTSRVVLTPSFTRRSGPQ
jgi:hypothetical protein